MWGNITKKRLMLFAFKHNPGINLNWKLVPVQYQKYEYCLLKAYKDKSKCHKINISFGLYGKISHWDLVVFTEQWHGQYSKGKVWDFFENTSLLVNMHSQTSIKRSPSPRWHTTRCSTFKIGDQNLEYYGTKTECENKSKLAIYIYCSKQQ